MDRFEAMTILLRVAEKGSFSAASRELRLPLASVSRKLAELETHLGIRLLHRTTRRVSLTEAGNTYLMSARRIIEEVEQAERVAAGEFQAPRGELVVTAPLLFGRLHILPAVTEFLAAFPEISIRLLLSDRNLLLSEDHVDVAVRIGSLPDSSLVATKIGDMRRVICAGPGLLAAHAIPQSPEALTALPTVAFFGLSAVQSWRFRQPGSGVVFEVPIQPRLSVTTAEAAIAASIANVGATCVLHYQCAEALDAGQLRLLLEVYEPEPSPVNLLHAARRELPLKTRIFIDFAAERLKLVSTMQTTKERSRD